MRRKAFIAGSVVTVGLVAGVLVLLYAACRETEPTSWQIRQLKLGMTQAEIEGIFGKSGILISQKGVVRHVEWKGPDRTVYVIFDGKGTAAQCAGTGDYAFWFRAERAMRYLLRPRVVPAPPPNPGGPVPPPPPPGVQ